jgi:hypothetical protein
VLLLILIVILTDAISLMASFHWSFMKVEPAKRTSCWNRKRWALVTKHLDLVTNFKYKQLLIEKVLPAIKRSGQKSMNHKNSTHQCNTTYQEQRSCLSGSHALI